MQPFTTSDGETIFVRASGAGPPLVLLHEWASNHRVWSPLMRGLEPRFTVYRWDARGHGGHALRGGDPPGVGRMAKDLIEMLDHFAIDRPLVAGHSMGALTVWEAIDRFGCGWLSRLCVIDQSPRLLTDDEWHYGIYYDWSPERNAAFVEGLRSDFVETVVRLIAFGRNRRALERYQAKSDSIRRLRAYLAMLDPEPLIAIWESLIAADYRPVLPRITVPQLLIYGSESNYYGPETGAYVARASHGAELIVYEGADHSPHLADPSRFVGDLIRFAARSRPRSGQR